MIVLAVLLASAAIGWAAGHLIAELAWRAVHRTGGTIPPYQPAPDEVTVSLPPIRTITCGGETCTIYPWGGTP